MPTWSSVRGAYARGGLRGVVTATRRRVARRLGRRPGGGRRSSATTTSPDGSRGRVTAETVDRSGALAFFEARRAVYEGLADAVAPFLPRDGVLLDVGANIGFFTQVLTERTGFRGRAHLFEPVPNLADLCVETAARLPCAVTVHRVGLGDADARVTIFVSSDGNLGWNTMVEQKARGKQMAPVEVEVARFDDLGLADVPDLVKIDVEGAEHRVLTGMLPALRRWSPRPVILCEVGWGSGHPEWEQELAAFAALAALGYETCHVDGVPLDVRDLRRTTDVLFVPRRGA
ncbi:hypothetical protein GCM10023258_21460 [Terrabacter aeriphilus]|uniref:Methyltransferase FkbM domain-containing protein n=1 Tax=Terrabacter aeriphilus TaxID=515662 RepID=A0ABP9JEH1_9MICO